LQQVLVSSSLLWSLVRRRRSVVVHTYCV
jgi:hypothetical protein